MVGKSATDSELDPFQSLYQLFYLSNRHHFKKLGCHGNVSDHQPIESGKEPAVRTFRYEEITVGMREARDYVITPEVYQGFLDTFHDHSPVHVDETFAKAQGFEGRVMHGTILNGLVSHFVGMYFPGRFSLLLSVDLRFSNPSYLGDSIRLEMVVSQKLDARSIIVLDATLSNTTRNSLAARGRIQVMIKEQA